MASQLVIPTDPIARKNLWREWIRHDIPQIDKPVVKRREPSCSSDQRFDIALIINDIKTNLPPTQYRIDPPPKPTWQWVTSILLVEAAMLMIGWKILVGF